MKHRAGYTLIECLLTLLLVTILLTIGTVSYQHLIARNKTSTNLNKIVTAIHYARSEALKRHLPVTLCKSNNGLQCNSQWRDGWLIFVDPLRKGQPENSEQILQTYSALPTGDQLIWRASLGKNDVLQFNSLGNAQQGGTFIYCPHNNKEYGGAVVVSITGRVRTENANVAKTLCHA